MPGAAEKRDSAAGANIQHTLVTTPANTVGDAISNAKACALQDADEYPEDDGGQEQSKPQNQDEQCHPLTYTQHVP
jgi:hypothetical protein